VEIFAFRFNFCNKSFKIFISMGFGGRLKLLFGYLIKMDLVKQILMCEYLLAIVNEWLYVSVSIMLGHLLFQNLFSAEVARLLIAGILLLTKSTRNWISYIITIVRHYRVYSLINQTIILFSQGFELVQDFFN